MTEGINLNEMQGADSTSANVDEGTGFDEYVYDVDVAPGETVTLTGQWSSDVSSLDGPEDNGDGQYTVIDGPTFGTFTLDSANGAMSWTFTYDDLVDNGGLAQQITFQISGVDYEGLDDIDTVTVNITCFVGGTLIAVPGGEVPVESLAIGDLVTTADARAVPVKWIGRQTIANHVFLSDRMRPVRIAAGALGTAADGVAVPHTDLYLSADHGLIVDGLVVNAGALVNGDTIRFVSLSEMPAAFRYFHVETEAHDEILANGATAETFVDYIGRKDFENYAEYLALFGSDRLIPEMRRVRISARRQLPKHLRDRFGIASFTETVERDAAELMAKLIAA